jgi:hypothetical protein
MKYLYTLLLLAPFTLSAAQLVRWESEESMKRIERSQYKRDFFKLSNHFEAQSNKLYCGPTSAAIVLNALNLRKNEDLPTAKYNYDEVSLKLKPTKWDPQFKRYTQENIFTKAAKDKSLVWGKEVNGKKDYGFQLRQFAKLLKSHGLKVDFTVVTEKVKKSKILNDLKSNLSKSGDFVIVNYSRKPLKQPGGGHLSPLAAYDEKSDSFLIMDVNPNKDSWVWVKTDDLIAAMNTFDTIENRGYLLISK